MQVILANSRNEGSVRDPHEDSKMLRLFIIVPKSHSEQDVKIDFSVCIINIMLLSVITNSDYRASL